MKWLILQNLNPCSKQLCIDLGCTHLKELNVSRNANYSSHRIISECLDIMSQILGEKVITNVQASPAIGFMADECTHISIMKDLIVYARILCGSEVDICFLKIINICWWQIWNNWESYSFLSFSEEGVAARLKQLNPEKISVHCINHHLALLRIWKDQKGNLTLRQL